MTTTLTQRSIHHGQQHRSAVATTLNRMLIASLLAGSALVAQTAIAQVAATATLDLVNTGSNGVNPSPISVGVNLAAWDTHMTDSLGKVALIPLDLRTAGVQIMRYPGGSTADNFHWYNQTVDNATLPVAQGGGTIASNINFDVFMGTVKAAGAQAMITVNYGSGGWPYNLSVPPDAGDMGRYEAESWVLYANKNVNGTLGNYNATYATASPSGHAYGIKYWEIGNEVYGDGTFGTGPNQWEYNRHALGAAQYAAGVHTYSTQMKQGDPSILVGAVLTAPGNWPDGVTNTTYEPKAWNDTVLQNACADIDFVDIHWYPEAPAGSGNGHEDDGLLLASSQNGSVTDTGASRSPSIASMVSSMRKKINQYCGAHASAVQIMVTETNSVYANPGKQTTSLVNALFEADDIMTWLENGVANVDWWAVHNGFPQVNGAAIQGAITNQATGSPLYGAYNFGDYGLLSLGQSAVASNTNAVMTEPVANFRFPAYYGMQMLSHVVSGPAPFPGSLGGPPFFTAITPSTALATQVSAYAVAQWNDQWADAFSANVLFINKDPNNSYTMTVSLAQLWPGSIWFNTSATVYSYSGTNLTGISQSSITPSSGSFTITLPPYSLTTVVVGGGSNI